MRRLFQVIVVAASFGVVGIALPASAPSSSTRDTVCGTDPLLVVEGPPDCGGPPYGQEYCKIAPGLYTYDELKAHDCEVDPIPKDPCPPLGQIEPTSDAEADTIDRAPTLQCEPDPRDGKYGIGLAPLLPADYQPTAPEWRELFAPPRCTKPGGCD